MNDTLKVAGRIGAELGAAKTENEKLRGLLRELREITSEYAWDVDLEAKVDAALSQQPEPTETFTAVDMATAAAQGFRDGQAAVEPAPAQDERQAFEAWMVEVEGARIRPRFDRVTAGPFADEYRDGRIQGAWNVWQARAARPAQTEQQPAYVECRECTDCGHVGINDAHQTDATCAMCDWSGPSPVEDQCPGCGKENAMGAACPKCSGRYRILAETHVAAPIAQTEQQPVAINPDPPELMIRWHESPESVHRAMWEPVAIREGMTYDELLAEGVTCGFDESGNEVEMEAGADIEGMRMQGCWAFVDTLNSCIHAWAAPDTDRGLVLHMLAHEISHATGTPHPDGFQEEMRAEQFGRVAAAAYRMLLDKDRPQCTAPACGCADAYCMAWPDEAAPIAQTALSAVTAERDRLQSQLAEAQANDRTAMGYLHDVRQLVGGSDFPEMVRNVARMADALPGCVELIEALSPFEDDVLRKAYAAMAAKEA